LVLTGNDVLDMLIVYIDRLCGLVVRVTDYSLQITGYRVTATDPEARVRFPALTEKKKI
jgi:hypothetical protein